MNRYPQFLLDENSAPPVGGGGSASPAPAEPGSSGPATPPEGVGDATEGAEGAGGGHDQFDGFDDPNNDYNDAIDLGLQDSATDDGSGAGSSGPATGGQGEHPAPATPGQSPGLQGQPAPPTPPAAPGGDVPQSSRSFLEEALDGFKNNQTQLSDWAGANLFNLSSQDAEALETDAVGTIPKLMGKVYAQSMASAANLIRSLVPQMIETGVSAQQGRVQRANEALSEFYQANPHLSADRHGAAVDRWAKSFRAANPQASRKDAIAFVGRAVSAEFGVWPNGGHHASGAGVSRALPFAPARQGGRAPPSAKGPHDPYAGMEDEYE